MAKNNNQKKDRSLKYFHGEAATTSVENAGTSYQSASIVAAGAADKDVALLSTLTNILLSFVLIKIPSMLDTRGSLKRVMLLFAFLSILTWIPLIAVLFFFKSVTPAWLIVLWIVSLIPTLVTGPLRDEWLAEKVPSSNMGRYLSVRSVISALVYLSALFLMGFFLDFSGVRMFQGYAVVLLVAFTGSGVTFLLYKKIGAPKTDSMGTGRVYFGFRNFLKEIKRGHVGKFVLYIALVNFAVNLCSSFFTVYMLKDLKFSYLTYTVIIAADFLARIISLTYWGRAIDRTGSLRVMGIVSRFIPIIPVLWIFSHNVAYLICIQFISGAIWAAFDLSNQTFIYRGVPRDLRLRYIVYHKSLSTFAVAVGALAGAFILNYVYPVFGSHILGLFLLSGIVRFIIVAGVFPRLNKQVREETTLIEEKRKSYGEQRQRVVPDIIMHRLPEQIPEYRPVPDAASLRQKVVISDMALPRGAFYHPENWPYYTYRPRRPTSLKIVPPGTGVYYHPVEWSKYKEGAAVKIYTHAVYPYDIQRLGLDKPVSPAVVN